MMIRRPRPWIWLIRICFLVAALTFGIVYQASAKEPTDLARVIGWVIDEVILPDHRAMVDAASAQRNALDALCAMPSQAGLTNARDRFADLIGAFSRIEVYRFGPSRSENRYERLFFWPDRGGRSLRQVQGVIANQDETALTVESLQNKSVALQGLVALDYLLAGTGNADLAKVFETGTEGATARDYRCTYALAAAGAIADTANDILEGWQGTDGYGALMLAPGPDNPVYRSNIEVIEDILQATAEQIQILRDLKLAAVIGDTPEDARPKRAPFWRSNVVLTAMLGNIDAVLGLHGDHALAALLPEEHAAFARSLRFELGQARRALSILEAEGGAWETLAAEANSHDALSYTLIPLAGAAAILGERYPPALGLTLGFNSLDGD
ncbi:MAG: imelysin family protein [Pseudomonadota bacterium]